MAQQPDWNFELTDLRYFRNVAQTLSFARGAERSHVSAPAISKSIRKMEESIGETLFERTTRRVRLTPVGELLLKYTDRVFATLDEARREIAHQGEELRGDLRVGAMEVFAVYALPRAIAGLVADHPQVVPRTFIMSPESMEERLLTGAIDVGLCVGRSQSRHLDCRPLIESPARLVCGRSHPLYGTSRITPGELPEHPFVVTQFFGREHLPPLDQFPDDRFERRIGATAELLQLGIQLVVEGGYLGYFPLVAIRCQLNHDELRIMSGLDLDETFELCALTRKTDSDKPAIDELIKRLGQSLAEALSLECAV